MKLEAAASVAQTYQGSVSNAASGSNVAKISRTVNIPNTGNVSNVSNITNITGQGKKADLAPAQTPSEAGRSAKRETENFETGPKNALFDAETEKNIPENQGVQQNSKQLQDAVQKLQEKMDHSTEAVFGIHEGTNRVMIKIVDRKTKDVIKEYPPEKTLDMIQKVWEMAGIMVDEKL